MVVEESAYILGFIYPKQMKKQSSAEQEESRLSEHSILPNVVLPRQLWCTGRVECLELATGVLLAQRDAGVFGVHPRTELILRRHRFGLGLTGLAGLTDLSGLSDCAGSREKRNGIEERALRRA
jgi:hypothetical protein